jgi:hypothetical protein
MGGVLGRSMSWFGGVSNEFEGVDVDMEMDVCFEIVGLEFCYTLHRQCHARINQIGVIW